MNRPEAPVVMLDPGNFTPHYDINLSMALRDEGWDVSWVTSAYQFERIRAPESLPVRELFFGTLPGPERPLRRPARFALKGLAYPAGLVRFHRDARRGPPGIIHVQWSFLPWLDAPFWAGWRRAGWKVVYTAHDVRPLAGTMPRLLAAGYSRLVRDADAVVVHSEREREAAIELGARPSRLRVIAPGAPIAPGARSVARQAARATLGLQPDVPIVLFFGFVKPYKGLSVLLRSLPGLIRSVGSVRLVIAGEIVGSRWRYERLAARLGISDSVRWLPGFVASSDVGTVFSAADVVALPYVAASSSGVLLTAYAFGRPVVATSVGGLVELVQACEAGVLVPPEDPPALGAAIAGILGEPERATRMGVEGVRLSRERFTWASMARDLDGLYRELLDAPGDDGSDL